MTSHGAWTLARGDSRWMVFCSTESLQTLPLNRLATEAKAVRFCETLAHLSLEITRQAQLGDRMDVISTYGIVHTLGYSPCSILQLSGSDYLISKNHLLTGYLIQL